MSFNVTVEVEGPGRPVTIQQLFCLEGGRGSDKEYYVIYSLTIFKGKKEGGPFTVLISGRSRPSDKVGGGGGHLDPEISEGGGVKKNFLGIWSKNKGGLPSLGPRLLIHGETSI